MTGDKTTKAVTSVADLQNLPATLRAEEVAALFRCSAWSIYESVKAGTCPAGPPLRIGRSMRWSGSAVRRALGLDPAPVHAGDS